MEAIFVIVVWMILELSEWLFRCFRVGMKVQQNDHKMATRLDLADAALLGHANASKGYSLKNLVEEMGLTRSEWLKWKKKYPTKKYFTGYELQEIDEYFGVINQED